MILPNLIPSQGPIDFKASYNLDSDVLHVMFRDPATWCQTHSIALKCKGPQAALRWLFIGLGAQFTEDGLATIWRGGSTSGIADGLLTVPMTLALAAEILLTEDIFTIWFTGSYAPFKARQYSLEILLHKQPFQKHQDKLLEAISKAFSSVTFPKSSSTERILLECEYLLALGTAEDRQIAFSKLAEIFILEKLGTEQAIVAQLETLQEALVNALGEK